MAALALSTSTHPASVVSLQLCDTSPAGVSNNSHMSKLSHRELDFCHWRGKGPSLNGCGPSLLGHC